MRRTRAKQFAGPGIDSVLLITASTLVTYAVLYYAYRANLPFNWVYRYLCLVPVSLTAYLHGLVPGLLLSALCSIAFLPQLFWRVQAYGSGFPTIEMFAFIIFLNVFAFFVADLGSSNRSRWKLMSAVADWEALVAKTSSLKEIVALILEQAVRTCPAQSAAFLLHNPLDAAWELVMDGEWRRLPSDYEEEGQDQRLVDWLLDQRTLVLLNDLHLDPRFYALSHESDPGLSLLARPLLYPDRSLMALLILMGKRTGQFTKSDSRVLDDLVVRSEKALEQAGAYAQTDLNLARQLKQLSAIQRASRRLNASLDADQIVEGTLQYALEIGDGQAGLAYAGCANEAPRVAIRGAALGAESTAHLLARAEALMQELTEAVILEPEDPCLPQLADPVRARLLVPIRREDRTLGLVLVDSARPRSFGESSLRALSALADHTAIALENARLFREVQREREQVGLIISSVADGLLTIDPTGRILTFNPTAEVLTGWRAEDSVGRTCREVLRCTDDGHDGQSQCTVLQALAEDRTVHEQRRTITQRRGGQRVISLSVAPLLGTSGQPGGFVILFRDITERDELDRLQRELVAAVSHQLRSPLAHIHAIAEILSTSEQDLAPGEYEEYLGRLQSQSQGLADFSDRILGLFHLETGQLALQPRPVPIDHLLTHLVRHWEGTTPTHSFAIRIPPRPPWVWADENALKTVLDNLIDNAVKYSPPQTGIIISVDAQEDGQVITAVQDQGPGIAPDYQPRIFDRFFRVDGSDAQPIYGHGLGLYIARKLVDAMGGQIWVQSQPGSGSCFALSLKQVEAGHDDKDIDR